MTASNKPSKDKKQSIGSIKKDKNKGRAFSKDSSKKKPSIAQNIPTITPEQMKSILDGCYEKALDGIPNVSKSVHSLAQDYTLLASGEKGHSGSGKKGQSLVG